MATTLSAPESATPKLDEKLSHPLQRLRKYIRAYVLLEGLLTAGVFLSVWFWAALVLDFGFFKLTGVDWVQDLPRELTFAQGRRFIPLPIQATVLTLVGIAFVGLLIRKIVIRQTRTFSDEALALVLERRYPELLGDRLITAVQLADLKKAESYGYSVPMVVKTVRDVRKVVDQVDLSGVFDWKRLYRLTILLAVLTLGIFIFCGAIYALVYRQPAFRQFGWRFFHVSQILAERNLLLKTTPWPRRAYFEFVDFPSEGELHLDRETPTWTCRVQAYQWVVPDRTRFDGWRPMTWGDLSYAILRSEPPKLPIELFHQMASENPTLASKLPSELLRWRDDPHEWKLDRVQSAMKIPEVRKYLNDRLPGQTFLELAEKVFDRLEREAARPSNWRKFRRLVLPETLAFRYRGKTTGEDADMPKVGEVYALETSFKESVQVQVRGEDAVSPWLPIILEPRPTFPSQTFFRTEYRPAYLFHRPPLNGSLLSLRGLKQELRNINISTEGPRSSFTIPEGTDFILHGIADKPLKSLVLEPVEKKFPGAYTGQKLAPIPIPLQPVTLEDGRVEDRAFEFRFTDAMRVIAPTEFKLKLTDIYGVVGERVVSVEPIADRAPDVNVKLDEAIRKVEGTNYYICTARARIAFAADSKISDDNGLWDVKYEFKVSRLESELKIRTKAMIAAGALGQTPQLPGLGSAIFGPSFLAGFGVNFLSDEESDQIRAAVALFGGAPPAPSWLLSASIVGSIGGMPVSLPTFLQERERKGRDFNDQPTDVPLEVLQQRLRQPPPPGAQLPMIRLFDFKKRTEEEQFHLMRYLPNLDRSRGQPRYWLQLTLAANDLNAENGSPVISRNSETFRILLVTEGEWLNEVTKEERKLGKELSAIIERLKEKQTELIELSNLINGPKSETEIQARLTEFQRGVQLGTSVQIQEAIREKQSETGRVLEDYFRILREYELNLKPDPQARASGTERESQERELMISRLSERICYPLRRILKGETQDGRLVGRNFERADKVYADLHKAIVDLSADSKQISDAQRRKIFDTLRANNGEGTRRAVDEFAELIAELEKVQSAIGELSKLQEVIKSFGRLVNAQKTIQEQLAGLLAGSEKSVTDATIIAPAQTIPLTGKSKVRFSVDFGASATEAVKVKIEAPPTSGLKITPTEVIVKPNDEDTETKAEFEVEPTQEGKFVLRLSFPSGETKTLELTVTK